MPEAPTNPLSHSSLKERNKNALEFIEDVTTNVAQVQTRVLSEILSRSANAEYLLRHGLNGRSDPHTFKKLIPIVEYGDLKPDIDRIANGDTSPILCSHPISEFLTSSGTSGGERKLMPMIEEEIERRQVLYSLLMPVMEQFVPGLEEGKAMQFLFVKSESKTGGGLLARPVLTSYYKSKHFRNRGDDPYTNYTSPDETILCPDSYQSMYAQLLCGLCLRTQVLRVGAVFASGFLRAIQFLQTHWQALAYDIRTGTLDSRITDQSVRESVMKILKPNPEVADVVEAECGKESWKGVITRIWPNTKYVDVIVTGTMSQYIPTLDYYTNALPLVCNMYASSECYFGLNLNPLCDPSQVSYTLIPTLGFFEFLPLHVSTTTRLDKDDLVDLVDVSLGHQYELVVTTYAGLYRYKVGDILQVTGFKNKAPQFKFVCRKNVVLSIDSDKTGEVELQKAVSNAAVQLQAYGECVKEYTSRVDTSSMPGHYVLYWEMGGETESKVPASVVEECCLSVEESLNSVYRQGRVADKSIGPLEIKMVEEGTFDKLMDYALSQGASINQYKTPRCVKFAPIVELLESRVVASYFSPKCPKWTPGHKQWQNGN